MSTANPLGKYQPYPEYLKSEAEWIGQLPSEWDLKRGKYVFSEINERSDSGDEQLLSVSEYYGVKPRQDVTEEGEFLSRAESLVGYKKCQVNDLAMNIMLAWKTGLGVSQYEGIISPAYAVFRFELSVAVPAYMHYLLRTEMYSGHFKTLSTGVIDSRLRLYPETFSTIEIVLPSIEEQRTIAAFLDYETARIDQLIAKQQQLIELLKEKRQAVISHAVTKGLNPNAPMKDSGVEWLGQVPEHWVVMPIRHLSSFVGTGGTPKDPTSFTEDKDILWFSPGDFNGDLLIDKSSKCVTKSSVINNDVKIYSQNSVLIVGIGATLGKVAVCQHEFSCNQQINIVTPNSLMCKYFMAYSLIAQTEQMKQISNASTIGIMNQEKTKNIRVAMPSLEEQNEIVYYLKNKLDGFSKMMDRSSKAINLLQERRTALISAAVTGKIDLRGWQPPKSEVAA